MTTLTNLEPAMRKYWHPAAKTFEVDNGPIRVVMFGEALVVSKLGDDIVVFADRCPHRNARLSDGSVIDDTLQCPYHGWRFDSDGGCAFIPALGDGATCPPTARLTPVCSRVRNGMVWVALDDPRTEPLAIAEWDQPDLVEAWLPTVTIRCGAAQFIDNFLDFTHFPFVHAGTFGAGEDELVHDYDVLRTDDGLLVRYEHLIANNEDPLVATGEHPLLQPRVMEYEYQVPFTARLRLELPMTGTENTIVVWAVPETEETIVLHSVLLRNDLASDEDARHAVDYEMSVLTEDVVILEHLPSTDLPLDLPAQVHLKTDRNTVEMRRLLSDAISMR